jgi:hypothetical protein
MEDVQMYDVLYFGHHWSGQQRYRRILSAKRWNKINS